MGKGVKERFRYFWPRILVFNNLNISNIRRNLPVNREKGQQRRRCCRDKRVCLCRQVEHTVRLLAMVREMMVVVSIRIVMVMMVNVTNMDMILRNSRGSVVRMMVMRNHCVIAHQQINRQQQNTYDLTLFHGRKNKKNSAAQVFARVAVGFVIYSYPSCPGSLSFSFFGKVASYASKASGFSSATK